MPWNSLSGLMPVGNVALMFGASMTSAITYEFPTREGMGPVKVVWYDGGIKPPAPRAMNGELLPASGELYVGDEGVMLDNNKIYVDYGTYAKLRGKIRMGE